MAIFKYKAIDRNGQYVKGRIDAANEPDLESRLGAMGLELLKQDQVTYNRLYISGRRITRQELINFCFHMEQMARAGVPILDSLVDLRDTMDNPRFREIISSIIVSIEGGKTFSEALAEFPKVFDQVFVSLIQAGEHSGELDKVLKNMTESLKWQDELAARTKKLFMYPAIVGTIVLSVVFFIMMYLVPQMVAFIKSTGGVLPLHTRILIGTSNFFVNYWHLILMVPVGAIILIRYMSSKRPDVRYRVDQFKLRSWLFGPILTKVTLARFATYFALLYRSGVSVLNCLNICQNISANTVIRGALADIEKMTSEGAVLSDAISRTGLFPPLILRMLKVGENTGRIDESLENVSYFYNREVRESVDRLQSIIEPSMTVVLGIILGWIMLSVLGPIYDILSTLKI